ncbi:MAG: hypothetical protein M3323_01185 [Actinomycetota bacterium]|nr:hypothetical protein [Actinomycetota bacterium]
MRIRTTIAGLTLAVATMGPLAGTAQAYHCYSDVVGDCSAVQHALEDFKKNWKERLCYFVENATLGTVTC